MKLRDDMFRILRDWDVEAATRLFSAAVDGAPAKPDVVEAGMHKARLAAGARVFGADSCAESEAWLRERGYRTTIGR